FRLLPAAAHLPRVAIDRLVVQREEWNLPPAAVPLASTAAERFLGIRRWAVDLGLPRFLFVKAPEERKPLFLDLDAPSLVEVFARLVRKASALALSEMLPTLDEAWLPDAEGNTY